MSTEALPPPTASWPRTKAEWLRQSAKASPFLLVSVILAVLPIFRTATFGHSDWAPLQFAPQLFVVLMLPFFVRRLSVLLGAAFIWLLASSGLIYLITEYPIIREVTSYDLPFAFGFLVPDAVYGVKFFLLPLFPLIVAVLASDRMRSPRRFAAGWFIAFFVLFATDWFLSHPLAWEHPLILDLIFWSGYLLLPALVWIPSYRLSLRRLLDNAESSKAHDFLLVLLGLVLMTGLVLSGGLIWLDAKVTASLQDDFDLSPIPQGAVNAKDALAPFLTNNDDTKTTEALGTLLAWPPSAHEALSEEQIALLDEASPVFTPKLNAIRAAAGADYLRLRQGPDPIPTLEDLGKNRFSLFIHLRETSRFVRLNLRLQVQRGQHEEARRDIHSVLRIAYLFNNDESSELTQHMSASALRGIAIGAIEDYYHLIRRDAQAAEEFRQWMTANHQLMHVAFPFDLLRERDPIFAPVLPAFYLGAIPSYSRAIALFHKPWAHADLIRIVLALDDHHRAAGHYPEELEQLVPQYLPHLPMDPEKNLPYRYVLVEKCFRLERPNTPDGFNVELEVKAAPAKED